MTRTVPVSPTASRTETVLTVLSLGQLTKTTRQVRERTSTTSHPDTKTTHHQSDSSSLLVVVESRENKERQSSQVEEINNPARESHSLYLAGYIETVRLNISLTWREILKHICYEMPPRNCLYWPDFWGKIKELTE